MITKAYSIDSLGFFPFKTCIEFVSFNFTNKHLIDVFWYAYEADIEDDGTYYIAHAPIILFKN